MAILFIEEYSDIVRDKNGDIADIPHISLGRTQLTIGVSSVATSFDFAPQTTFVILYAEQDSYILFGDNTVTADANSFIMPRGFRSFGVQKGDTRVAVITK